MTEFNIDSVRRAAQLEYVYILFAYRNGYPSVMSVHRTHEDAEQARDDYKRHCKKKGMAVPSMRISTHLLRG